MRFKNKKGPYNCKGEIRGIVAYNKEEDNYTSELLTNVILTVSKDNIYNSFTSNLYEGVKTTFDGDDVVLLNGKVIRPGTVYCSIKKDKIIDAKKERDLGNFIVCQRGFYKDKIDIYLYKKYLAIQNNFLEDAKELDCFIELEKSLNHNYEQKLIEYYDNPKVKSKRL